MQSRRRKIYSDQQQSGIGSQILGLSLFVMLLAFFIVLNSKSSFEDMKAQPVAQSIAQSFSSKTLVAGDNSPSMIQSVQQGSGEGDTVELLDALFKSQIKTAEVVTNKQRGLMIVRVKRTDFEKAVTNLGTAQGGEFGEPFLQTLGSLLRSDKRKKSYQMDMVFFTSDNPAKLQNEKPQEMVAVIKAAAKLAESLEKSGLPAKLMTIGLQQGDPLMVELYFGPHTVYRPPMPGAQP